MKLSRKTLLVLAVTFTGLLALLFVLSKSILLDRFAQLEKQDTTDNILRLRNVLEENIASLGNSTRDYASWDDTYAYMADQNPSYIEANFVDDTFINLRINYVALIDANGLLLFKKGFDLETQEQISVPDPLIAQISKLDPSPSSTPENDGISGILMVDDRPIIFSMQPVLQSDRSGPTGGLFVFGRILNDAEITRLARITQLDVNLLPWKAEEMPSDVFQALESDGHQLAIKPLNNDRIAGYTLIRDANNQPVFVLEIELPRDIYFQGQISILYLFASLTFASLVFGTLMWLLLRHLVIAPVTKFSENINAIGSSRDLTLRLPEEGSVEISKLSRVINTLLDKLEQHSFEVQRSHNLQRRLVQMRTAAEISRLISGVLDPKVLLTQVVNLVQERFRLYYVGVFLLDDDNEYAVLQAGTGEAGERMLREGHKLLAGGSSMIGWTIANRKARIALDVGHEAVRFSNPHLPLTRSELALPIQSGNAILGALTVQSTEPSAFDKDDITVLQGIADSLGTALENAKLFSQSQRNLREIQAMHRQYLSQAWSELTAVEEELQYSYERSPVGSAENHLLVPVKYRDQVVGNLSLETDQPVSNDDLALIDEVVAQTALALENVRLLEETKQKAEKERIAAHFSKRVWSSNDMEIILQTAIRELSDSLGASEGEISLDVSDEPSALFDENGREGLYG